jgi:hypothetical protein
MSVKRSAEKTSGSSRSTMVNGMFTLVRSGSAAFMSGRGKSKMRSAATIGGATKSVTYVLRPFCHLCLGLLTRRSRATVPESDPALQRDRQLAVSHPFEQARFHLHREPILPKWCQ